MPKPLSPMLPLAACLLAGWPVGSGAATQRSPSSPPNSVANPASLVFCDASTRFTMLTPLLVRVEHSDAGAFEDRPTMAFVNRYLPAPTFKVANVSGWCNITLEDSGMAVSIRTAVAAGVPLLARALQVHSRDGSLVWDITGQNGTSTTNPSNLGGNVYDLKGNDGATCHQETTAAGICVNGKIDLTCKGSSLTSNNFCTQGVLTSARGGAHVYNESENMVMTGSAGNASGWWARSVHAGGQGHDLYLFLHGSDHKAGLRNLAAVSGRQPVPPRRFFGVWWSRWDKYTTQELRDMASTYEANLLPLDGINMDTEWHKNQVGYLDGNGINEYSGVFDWDSTLYPSPPDMMNWLEDRGLWPVN